MNTPQNQSPLEVPRSREELIRAHDVFNAIATCNSAAVRFASPRNERDFQIMAAMLCWVLGHQNPSAEGVQQTLDEAEKGLTKIGAKIIHTHDTN
jgi:hypothetical protein